MFGRIQPVKNGNAAYAAEPGGERGDDTAAGDVPLRRSCQEFLKALQACAAFNSEMSSAGRSEPTDSQDLEEIAYEKMERSLQELRSQRALCSAGFQAKLEALFALEDWFGQEDSRVVGFTLELLREVLTFIVDDQAGDGKPFPKINGGSSGERRESRLSFPRLLRFGGEPISSMPRRARRSQS